MAEISVEVGGRPVAFKATGGTGYRYKAQFGREFIADLIELESFRETKKTVAKTVDGKKQKREMYDYTRLNLETFYNILWVLAKTADDTIPDPQTWLDSFDEFPVMQIFQSVQPVLQQNMRIDAKNG